MKIAMIGTGYVGLVSGACFSEFGVDVTCVDRDRDKIAQLNNGKPPIYEPGLPELLDRNMRAGRVRFTTDVAAAVADADAAFLAVGTPTRDGDDRADLSSVYVAARRVAAHAPEDLVLVTKSTVPVGTTRDIARIVTAESPNRRLHVAANPEFLREGAAIEDFTRPQRIIVGVQSDHAARVLDDLYRPLTAIDTPTMFTELETAELIKYAANAFLATKVTFINEIADLCERVGADVDDVARGLGLDARIGSAFLRPGPGYGGSCFPKDTRALIRTARDSGAPVHIVESVTAVNEARKEAMAHRIAAACGGDVAGRTIGVLGVTFKANTDDLREAPSRTVIPMLQRWGARVRAHDPAGMPAARRLFDTVTWCSDAYEALYGASCGVVLTEWNEYLDLDMQRVKTNMLQPRIVDLRNIYDPAAMRRYGFAYTGLGRAA